MMFLVFAIIALIGSASATSDNFARPSLTSQIVALRHHDTLKLNSTEAPMNDVDHFGQLETLEHYVLLQSHMSHTARVHSRAGLKRSDNDGPVVTGTPDLFLTKVEDGFRLNLSSHFFDAENDPLTFTATGLPDGAIFDTESCIIEGAVDFPSISVVTIEATDGKSTVSAPAFYFIVCNKDGTLPSTSPSSSMLPSPSASTSISASISLSPSVNAGNNGTGAGINGTGPAQNGTGPSLFEMSEDHPSFIAIVEEPFQLNLVTAYADYTTTQAIFNAAGLPDGVQFDSNTGVIAGIVGSKDAGVYQIEVGVTNNVGEESELPNFILMVSEHHKHYESMKKETSANMTTSF